MPTKFKKEISLSAVRISKIELYEIASQLAPLINTANGGSIDRERYSVRFKNGKETVGADNWTDQETFQKSPEGTCDFKFEYQVYQDVPISTVTIDFDHSSRAIEVSGTDLNKVQAMIAAIQDKFQKHITIFGGLAFSVFMFIFFAFVVSFISYLSKEKDASESIKLVSAVVNLGWAAALGYSFIADKSYFPGTVVYETKGSFVHRNSAMISFWGLILAVVGLAFSIYQLWSAK